MDKVKKNQRLIRRLVTNTAIEVDAEIKKDQPNLIALKSKKQKLEDNLEQLVILDQKVLDSMIEDGQSDADCDAEFDTVQKYRDMVRVSILAVETSLPHSSPSSSVKSGCTSKSCSEGRNRNFKLPTIELVKFNGDLKEWLGFWSQFSKIDEDKGLHVSDKFQYLLQAMERDTEAFEIVNSYPATAENYPKAVEALKDRFGRESLLLQVYIRELLKLVIVNVTHRDKMPLDKMYLKLESHLRALSSLNLATADPVTWLFPLVESSLPEETLRAWQRSELSRKNGKDEKPPKTCLDYLMDFIKLEVQSEQRICLAQAGFQNAPLKQKVPKKSAQLKIQEERSQLEDPVTVAGLYVGQKSLCLFCEKPHESDRCVKSDFMTLFERKAVIKKKKACFQCLKLGHGFKNCEEFVRCILCSKNHFVIMCPDLPKHQKGSTSEKFEPKSLTEEVQKLNATFAGSSMVLLGTFRSTLLNGDKRLEVRALYDPGAQRSYVTSRAAASLNLRPISEEKVTHSLFGGIQTDVQVLKSYQLNIENTIGRGTTVISVLEKTKICGEIPRLPPGPWLKELKKNQIWISDMTSTDENDIDLLVGADIYGKLLTGRSHQVNDGLTAIETILGWVVLGSVSSKERNQQNLAMAVISMFVSDEVSIEQLWSLEAIGIQDPGEHKSKTEREVATKEHFLRTVSRNPDGRYSVRLPWTDGIQNMPNNKKIAMSRLNSATAKLHAAGKYREYGKIFDTWLEEGIIELVDVNDNVDCHYLPHRPVFKPTSKTTPVRPVFDASCKIGRNPSLNDCLEKGPNLLEKIPSNLLRFRERKLGVSSDIGKAFLMIETNEDDRDFLRFLWWEELDRKCYKVFRHCRVVFEVNCSPFILAAVLEFHLSSVQDDRKDVAQKLLKALYVDNCVTSVDSFSQYENFQKISTELLAEAKMELRQWEVTVGEEFGVGSLPISECGLNSASSDFSQELTNVLGYQWNKLVDTMKCDLSNKYEELPEKLSKRVILSRVQKVFDPLGILCPAMLPPKTTLQRAWKKSQSIKSGKSTGDGVNQNSVWDAELPEDIKQEFRNWYKEAHILGEIAIPRSLRRNFISEELHVFGDASMEAYATVAFLRVEMDNGVEVRFIQAKSRVAPLKKMSIPRLELMACTITARLTTAIRDAIDLKDVPTYLWSDSTTALAWVQRNDEWGTFVGNRVKEILKLTAAENWRHVPGALNPADLPSRGCSARELVESKWWEGPQWLRCPHSEWPGEEQAVDEELVLSEKKKTAIVLVADSKTIPWYVNFFPDYSSNVRVIAWILRFWGILRKKPQERGQLTPREVQEAEMKMVKAIQKEVFPEVSKSVVISGVKVEKEADGILRVKTKLQNREDILAFKSPVLLPSEHPFVEQLIREVHTRNRHAGAQFIMGKLREKFWILQGRRAVKQVVSRCVPCRRFTTKASSVPEAPLPEDRVKEAKTFQITGVDLAGPLFLRNGAKAWIVLFTCAFYRAVHLEMVLSLSSESFVLALHRFISRRGRPEKIYSDNGTNFVGANNLFAELDWKKIEQESRTFRIQWKFNPPSAPWL